jgi:hypothetical protein
LGHTCVIYAKDDARIREFGLRMPAFRCLVNTPAPQGSTGITTGVMPSMTLGCGAMAGNSTSDNVGPQHLINVKRLAYPMRTVAEAFQGDHAAPAAAGKALVTAAVDKYLAQRGIGGASKGAAASGSASVAAQVVDRFLQSRGGGATVGSPMAGCACDSPSSGASCAAPGAPTSSTPAQPPAPPVEIVDFVCEADVRAAMKDSRKIYIGPKTIVTPAARELASRQDTLVVAQR